MSYGKVDMDKYIPDRLKNERIRLNLSQKDIADAVDVTSKTVGRWERDDAIPSDKLALLVGLGFDALYILTGKQREQLQDKNVSFSLNSEFAHIPVYDVEVSAGDGRVAYGENPLYHFAYRKDWLLSRGLHVKDLHVVMARGDSMEPTISDGESILVNTSEKDPKDGHIYVIRSGDTLWVKRVQCLLGGSLSLISDNKMYAPMKLDLETLQDVQVIGKVVNSSKNFY